MCPGSLQSLGHFLGFAIKKQRPDRVNGVETHSSRSSCRKNAERKFFPKSGIRSFTPNFIELTEPIFYFLSSGSMSCNYPFDCYRFLITLHFSLSIARFYERVRNIVNEVISERLVKHRTYMTYSTYQLQATHN